MFSPHLSTSVKTLSKAERSGFKKMKQNKLHKAFPVLSWPGRTMFSRKVYTRCWLTWDQFLHFAISVTLYPNIYFCRLYSGCTISEAHLETQWKRKPKVCGPEGCRSEAPRWNCLGTLKQTEWNVPFIPYTALVYSKALEWGVFISPCAARTWDKWKEGGYK